MNSRREVYRQLVKKYGPIWIDQQGDFWPVCMMTDRRMVNVLRFVRARLDKLETSIDDAIEELDLNQLSNRVLTLIDRKGVLSHWDLLLTQELKARGVNVEEQAPGNLPACPYCGQVAQLVTGEAIYPHRPDLVDRNFWLCRLCDAYVGCHDGTERPLGTLANAEVRASRSKAHAAFDPLWRDKGKFTSRRQAYAWLADKLGVRVSDCHIGQFDVATCQRVVALVEGEYGKISG